MSREVTEGGIRKGRSLTGGMLRRLGGMNFRELRICREK
jgi:hypothetical protein